METIMERCLVFFLKYPEPGRVKTRLAVTLGPEAAGLLYAAFVPDCLAALRTVDAELLVCLDPAERSADCHAWLDLSGTLSEVIGQEGSDLGERMHNGLAAAFARGADAAVLVGADLPDLPAAYLDQAFALLRTHDAVLGATLDGGYYCVGMKPASLTPAAFAAIAWSGPQVFAQTQARLAAAGQRLALLPPWRDIDDIDDLRAFVARQRNIRAPGLKSYALALALLEAAGLA